MLTELYIEAILRGSMPPDEDRVKLIKKAYPEGQLGRLEAELARLWLFTQLLQFQSNDRGGDWANGSAYES